MNPYEEITYESEAFPESHPARLGALGRLFGLTVADVRTARVLEIGCASGNNLLPMACTLPEASFCGLDLSESSIAVAENTRQQLDLNNIRFLHGDINTPPQGLGEFDYIIAHGMYSWVSESTRDSLLDLCRGHLAPEGLVYLSFNTLPGGHQRAALREMVLMETGHISDPTERLRSSRNFMQTLKVLWSEHPTKDTSSMLQHVELYLSFPDWFLYHDLLGEIHHAEYLGEVIARADKHELLYVGDADPWKMAPLDLSERSIASLRGLATNHSALEQRLDFIRLETFRRSIFTRKGRVLERENAILRLPHLLLSTMLKQVTKEDAQTAVFQGSRGVQIQIDDAVVKSAIKVLSERWPGSMDFGEIAAALSLDDSPSSEQKLAVLIQGLFRCLLAGQIIPSIWEPPLARSVAECPLAFSFSRYQAQIGKRVTSLLHAPVELDSRAQNLLLLLDGTRDRRALLEALPEMTEDVLETLLVRFLENGLLEQLV